VYNLTAGRVKLKLLKMKKLVFTAFAVGLSLTANFWAQVPSYVPTNGLVGYWPFNGNANDESGNGNNGTVNGATLTADRNGVANKAYSFDGVNNYISSNIGSINNVTIALWYNPSYPSDYYPLLISLDDIRLIEMAGNHPIWLNNNTVGHLGSYPDAINSLPCIPNFNQWHFVVMIYDHDLNQHKIYIDNSLCNSGSTSSFLGSQNGNIIIGNTLTGLVGGAGSGYLGKMDEFGIWNRALTDCEIQDLYNAQINSVAGSVNVSPNPASIGANVTLSSASNSTNVQWQSNPSNFGWQNVPSNTNYSGGTTNTLTISNVQLSNHNQPFRVIANTGNCSDTSNVAIIQIADTCITTVYDTLLTTVTDTLIINTTLSLPAPNNENTILIYPNPASDHITIDNGNFSAMAGYTIKIENNAGQQVFQSLINQAQFYVDLSTWSGNGLYFVHLIDPQNNTVTVRKIVLQ
jgi:hypothetical protein